MFKKQIFILAIISIMLSLYSCDTNTVYNEHVDLHSYGWPDNKSVSFNINITDTLNPHDFGLVIRNNTSYRYSNLYLFLLTEFPNGNISRDTIECMLANEEGKWLGKGWSDVKENKILLKSGLRFPLTGTYKFLIQQAMRVDTLNGLSDIGIFIEKDHN